MFLNYRNMLQNRCPCTKKCSALFLDGISLFMARVYYNLLYSKVWHVMSIYLNVVGVYVVRFIS